ncbi:MAG: (d)CMP kinase [Puniceicoccales bacterium]|jgi:cytidylate kinase|nr:(d)CMP kinase [Puniceicoccales bacterium]
MKLIHLLFFSLIILRSPVCFGKATSDDFVHFNGLQELLDAHRDEVLREILMEKKGNFLNGFTIVAIDGAAGSGKTSTAKKVAQECHFAFVSTGDHYRTMARYFLDHRIAPSDHSSIASALSKLHPTTRMDGNCARLCIGEVIANEADLHNGEINSVVADYAQDPSLRTFLHAYQRQLPAVIRSISLGGMVIEGRDVTSVVFPNATLRLFLRADLGERRRRRLEEGIGDDVESRDAKDHLQLQCVDGVLLIDSTQLSLEEVVLVILKKIDELPSHG